MCVYVCVWGGQLEGTGSGPCVPESVRARRAARLLCPRRRVHALVCLCVCRCVSTFVWAVRGSMGLGGHWCEAVRVPGATGTCQASWRAETCGLQIHVACRDVYARVGAVAPVAHIRDRTPLGTHIPPVPCVHYTPRPAWVSSWPGCVVHVTCRSCLARSV